LELSGTDLAFWWNWNCYSYSHGNRCFANHLQTVKTLIFGFWLTGELLVYSDAPTARPLLLLYEHVYLTLLITGLSTDPA
jgi:hypothetical protein